MIDEKDLVEDSSILVNKITGLLRAKKILRELGDNFGKFAKPNAAEDMAKMILLVIRKQGRRKS